MRIRSIPAMTVLVLAVAFPLATLARCNPVAPAGAPTPPPPAHATESAPTPPATPTDGPTPTYGPAPTFESLTDPIDTREEAIAKAYKYDRLAGLAWEVPWDPSTPDSDPDRFIILRFPDLETEASLAGEPVEYTGDILRDAGMVWSVTILGDFSQPNEPSTVAHGATYVISQRSGVLYTERRGLLVVPPTPTATPPVWGSQSMPPAVPTLTRVWQPPTPLPDPGIRLGPPREVPLGPGIDTRAPIWGAALQDNTFVAAAQVPGGRTIVEIDLLTGELRYLMPIDVPPPGGSPYVGELKTSGRYVAWVQYTGTESRQLHVLDRTTLVEVPPEAARDARRVGSIEFKDDLLLWRQADLRPAVLYGYDLRTRREFVLMEDAAQGYIRLCSRDWFIYLADVPTTNSEAPLDLHAHNLNTDEDLVLGTVVYPDNQWRGQQHACDGEDVVWIGPPAGYFHFNLATRTRRLLAMPGHPGYGATVRVSGDIVVAATGYSFSRDVAFNLFASLPLEMNYGGPLTVSGETFAWISDYGLWEGRLPWRLFTATIVRDAFSPAPPQAVTAGPSPPASPRPVISP